MASPRRRDVEILLADNSAVVKRLDRSRILNSYEVPRREKRTKDPVPAHILRRAIAAVNADLVTHIQKLMIANTERPREQNWLCISFLLIVAAVENPGSLHLTEADEVAKRLTPKQRQHAGLIDAGAYSQVQSAVALWTGRTWKHTQLADPMGRLRPQTSLPMPSQRSPPLPRSTGRTDGGGPRSTHARATAQART